MAKTATSAQSPMIYSFLCLHEQANQGNSDTTYTGLYQLVGSKTKVRLQIKANSYTFQSSAKAEMWTPQGWAFIWHIDPEQILAKRIHRSGTVIVPTGMFMADIEKLLRAASLVLDER